MSRSAFKPNAKVLQRLRGLRELLKGAHAAGKEIASSTRGGEREQVAELLLRQSLNPLLRLGSGEITDRSGRSSGQVDIVVENLFAPTLPCLTASSRLYLAEGVAAAIEVKSDLQDQWSSVEKKAQEIGRMRREFGGTTSVHGASIEHVPTYAVGFTGWKRAATLRKKLASTSLRGALVIEPGVFVTHPDLEPSWMRCELEGEAALLGLLWCLQTDCNLIREAGCDVLGYVRPALEH